MTSSHWSCMGTEGTGHRRADAICVRENGVEAYFEPHHRDWEHLTAKCECGWVGSPWLTNYPDGFDAALKQACDEWYSTHLPPIVRDYIRGIKRNLTSKMEALAKLKTPEGDIAAADAFRVLAREVYDLSGTVAGRERSLYLLETGKWWGDDLNTD